MSGEIEAEAVRPRPLSGGLWNIFSWLRREDSSSNDSLSSVGSTHTAASFAFLGPAHYASPTPIQLPPQGPPTDTYKKRLQDRNLRRQQDRNLTLHRKYGLYGVYDAFSLPSSRRGIADFNTEQNRERRATSECFQRRPAHVPGKRRAPQPPLGAASTGHASFVRRNRKRPAPQPPHKVPYKSKENIEHHLVNKNTNILKQMNSKSIRGNSLTSNDDSVGCKSEKYSKKESSSNDGKSRPEKNFIKQIFESKKRNSGIETATTRVKILPSISELDKQAAEIIKACRQMEKEIISEDNKVNPKKSLTSTEIAICKFCNKCFKKYNSIAACPYCVSEVRNKSNKLGKDTSKSSPNEPQNIYTQTEQSVTISEANKIEEREKLKGMLKEMKYSLPKRPKNNDHIKNDETRNSFLFKSNDNPNSSLETPTLKVGSSLSNNTFNDADARIYQPSSSNSNVYSPSDNKNKKISKSDNITNDDVTEKIFVTQTKVITDNQYVKKLDEKSRKNKEIISNSIIAVSNIKEEGKPNKILTKYESKDKTFKESDRSSNEINLHTPLRISSLLNPVYIPKNYSVDTQSNNNTADVQSSKQSILSSKDKQIKQETNNTTCMEPLKATKSFITDKNKLNANRESSEDKQMKNVKVNAETQLTAINSTPVKLIAAPLATPGTSSKDKPSTSYTSVATPSSLLTVSNKSKLNEFGEDQHSKRRDLIIQLEQSIAKGDEQSAAEAAVKLAQLRLSCSVLSFSSQIMNNSTEAMTNKSEEMKTSGKDGNIKLNEPSSSKTDSSTQSVTAVIYESDSTRPRNLKTVMEINESHEGLEKNSQVIPQKATTNNNDVEIEIWVEDKEAARGPISLRIPRHAVLGELRQQAEISLGLAARLQRWIIGRVLCTDDNTPLASVAGPNFNVPFYLCLVEAGSNEEVLDSRLISKATNRNSDVYSELMLLEQRALVSNTEIFECEVCMEECLAGEGAILRECVHTFCRGCLSDVVRHCEEPVVNCPALGCIGIMQEREIRALVSPEDYERWLARGLAAAESGTRNAFHCRTRDCTGWALCEPGVQKFPCPVCKHTNCVLCQAIHEGETCEQHRRKVQEAVKNVDMNQTDEGTKTLIESLISKGEALECPECSAIITKKWGCDWVKCSACKTEICWVTRGRRWGPAGRGDTSGGCRCGVDGKRCHPACGYCH